MNKLLYFWLNRDCLYFATVSTLANTAFMLAIYKQRWIIASILFAALIVILIAANRFDNSNK